MLNLRRPFAVTALAAALMAGSAAWAATLPPLSVRSGGASFEEFQEMNAQARDYTLKLVMAARGSGAYLADVNVVVRSLPNRQTVLTHQAEGPLLLAALPPGRYEVSATTQDVRPGAAATQTRQLTIPRQGLAQMVMYFDTGDEVEADRDPAGSTR